MSLFLSFSFVQSIGKRVFDGLTMHGVELVAPALNQVMILLEPFVRRYPQTALPFPFMLCCSSVFIV